MRALVALTAFMGILLLAGIGVIIVTLVHRATQPKPPAPVFVAGHANLSLPPDAKVAGMIAVGDRALLQIVRAEGPGALILLDPASGAVLETIDLVAQSPAVHP